MSDLHCRYCDCLECAPGFPAAATRVYSTRAIIFMAPMRSAERAKKNARERARIRMVKMRCRNELRALQEAG